MIIGEVSEHQSDDEVPPEPVPPEPAPSGPHRLHLKLVGLVNILKDVDTDYSSKAVAEVKRLQPLWPQLKKQWAALDRPATADQSLAKCSSWSRQCRRPAMSIRTCASTICARTWQSYARPCLCCCAPAEQCGGGSTARNNYHNNDAACGASYAIRSAAG